VTKPRALTWSWLSLWVLIAASYPFAIELAGGYRGVEVVIRPFMVLYDSVLLGAHAVVLVVMIIETRERWFGAALAVVFLFLLAPLYLGSGPFVPGSTPLAFYRAFVFAPALLRDAVLGLTATRLAIGWRRPALAALFTVDLALILYRWWSTPIAVVATAHPWTTAWVGLAPLCAATVLALPVRRRR
jgi:hypothetical protein